ncbi:hypothetical protein EGM85_12455 [Macrococcus caseolyticus]|nr:hypothetical protein [Macrococcus caseolyticus]RKO09050.1 hypothetical protein D6861_12455 [Macrococcus caseolyticus]
MESPMDSFFPSFCSVCDKTLDGCSSSLYCSEDCRKSDSIPNRPIYFSDDSKFTPSSHNILHSHHGHSHSMGAKHPTFSLQYPSVFTPHSIRASSPRKIEDQYLPASLPDLSLSEDEGSLTDDYDIPALSLEAHNSYLHR